MFPGNEAPSEFSVAVLEGMVMLGKGGAPQSATSRMHIHLEFVVDPACVNNNFQ
jgi:hypothetical protein